jgi:very-short-patch-repair endonuclease
MMGVAQPREWVELAERQHGVVGRAQLRELGMTSDAVRHAVSRGRLRWISRRVLRVVGSADTPHQRAMAAVLDASDAAVALASAVSLWGVPGWRLEPVHVLTDRRPHRGTPHLGIVHSTVRLDPSHVTVVDRIPVTTPARTLLDLSLRLRPFKLEDLCDDLLRRRIMSVQSFHAVVADLPESGGPTGWAVLRRLATERGPGFVPTGSKLERRFEVILERAGDAPFERQVDLGDDEGWIGRVDFADRNLKVVVEVQGETFHSSLSDRRRDAERFRRLRAAGWIVVEIAEDEIFRRPELVIERVRSARALARTLAA